MISMTIKLWQKPKSIFGKGAAISGILTVLIILIDLILNRTLITQYIFVLTYSLIVFAAINATGKNIIMNLKNNNDLNIIKLQYTEEMTQWILYYLQIV